MESSDTRHRKFFFHNWKFDSSKRVRSELSWSTKKKREKRKEKNKKGKGGKRRKKKRKKKTGEKREKRFITLWFSKTLLFPCLN